MLIITQIPAAHCSPEEDNLSGQNRFECRTCPYQMVLDRRYYERKTMKLKAVEDILGGADSWKTVYQTEGTSAWCKFLLIHKLISHSQPNAPTRTAIAAWHISDKCRFAVQTSP